MTKNLTQDSTKINKRMNCTTWCLQLTNGLNNIINLFSGSFLVSYIMSINASLPIGKSLVSIALYYIALYFVMGGLYFLLSYLVDKSNRIWYYRAALLIKGIFIVLIIFLGKDLAKLSALAGAMYGFAEACYWSSYNVMKGELVPRVHADSFALINTLLGKVVNVVFPTIIGLLIDVSTFITVSIYVLIIVAIQIILSCFIKSHRPQGSTFEIGKYFKKLKKNTEDIKRIKRFYPITLAYGFTSICTTLVSFLAIYTFKTNFNLGIFTSVFAVLSIVVLLLVKRFSKEGHRKFLYILVGTLPVLSAICVIIDVAKWSYILFNICETVCLCVVAYTIDYQRTTILKKTGHYSDIAEHQTLTEVSFCLSRVISYVLMLVLGLTLDLVGLKILVFIVSLSFPLMAIFTQRMEKVEMNYPIEVKIVSVEVEEMVCETKSEQNK